jgi:hypothetical protein
MPGGTEENHGQLRTFPILIDILNSLFPHTNQVCWLELDPTCFVKTMLASVNVMQVGHLSIPPMFAVLSLETAHGTDIEMPWPAASPRPAFRRCMHGMRLRSFHTRRKQSTESLFYCVNIVCHFLSYKAYPSIGVLTRVREEGREATNNVGQIK